MEAIVLAGGFGTRLSHIVSDVPKPMASVNGKPFLKYILKYLYKNGIKNVILAVGYKSEIIKDYFGDNYNGINITYSFEEEPLGTGGAIKKALEYCNEDDIFIINGDTYFEVDLKKMKIFHNEKSSNLTIAVKHLNRFERYGAVIIEDDKIKKFEEKKPMLEGIINGGIYIIRRNIMNLTDKKSFSFEKIILENDLVDIYAFESMGYFIDIGIPEDYFKAQIDFKKLNL